MKNYTITVNGNSYDVTVEEKGSAAGVQPAVQAAPAPKKAAVSSGAKGKIEVKKYECHKDHDVISYCKIEKSRLMNKVSHCLKKVTHFIPPKY